MHSRLVQAENIAVAVFDLIGQFSAKTPWSSANIIHTIFHHQADKSCGTGDSYLE